MYFSKNHPYISYSLHFASKVSKHLLKTSSFDFNILFFKSSFIILNTNSTGAKSGEYSGICNKEIQDGLKGVTMTVRSVLHTKTKYNPYLRLEAIERESTSNEN